MRNFTVGPVMSSDTVLSIGAEQIPYFRTAEFSSLMLENEEYILKFSKAPKESKCVFLTCSSTGAMEAVVMNCFSKDDKVLIINGGSFGQRFVDICNIYEVPHHVLYLKHGQKLTRKALYKYDNLGFTGLLVNVDETSTAVLYDAMMIGEFCKRNNMFFVCDCVSSFLADSFNMSKCNADIMITGSQKALACPPGIAIIVLSAKGICRVHNSNVRCMYFNLSEALKNQERGQTPFTPAVSVLLQINARLKEIDCQGGVDKEIARVRALAQDFREKIKDLPFELVSESPANAVTALHPKTVSAFDIFEILKDEYNIWVCPNGGNLKDKVFRVGHIGALTYADNDVLVRAFYDLLKRGVI